MFFKNLYACSFLTSCCRAIGLLNNPAVILSPPNVLPLDNQIAKLASLWIYICIEHKTNIQCFLQITHLHSTNFVVNIYELVISQVYIPSDKLLCHMGKDLEMLILQTHHPIISTWVYYFLQVIDLNHCWQWITC